MVADDEWTVAVWVEVLGDYVVAVAGPRDDLVSASSTLHAMAPLKSGSGFRYGFSAFRVSP